MDPMYEREVYQEFLQNVSFHLSDTKNKIINCHYDLHFAIQSNNTEEATIYRNWLQILQERYLALVRDYNYFNHHILYTL